MSDGVEKLSDGRRSASEDEQMTWSRLLVSDGHKLLPTETTGGNGGGLSPAVDYG